MKWLYGQYESWINEGCPKNTEVTELDISGYLPEKHNLTSIHPQIYNLENITVLRANYTGITSIPSEIGRCVNLRELYFENSKLTSLPPEIGNCVNLQKLLVGSTCLTSLPPEIGNCVNLTQLMINFSIYLTSLPPELGNCVNLQYLWCSHNRLTSLPPELGNCVNLRDLRCSFNRLTSLPPELGNCVNLVELACNSNKITSLPPELGNCANLEAIFCEYNIITSLPAELGNCLRIQNIRCVGNPIEHIPPNIRRILDRQRVSQGVYTDAQSVHNSQIQTSIKESILRLLSIKPKTSSESTTAEIVADPVLTAHTKESLIEYSKCTEVHSVLNISFGELLDHVWTRIQSNEHSVEIKHVLDQEMADATCMCFTGRISRLVNALNGFDDLVRVNIGDNEQIGTIISLVKNRLDEKSQYTREEHVRIARLRLTELGYPSAVIEEWVGYI